MKNLTQEEWREMLSKESNAIVLDVRTPEEWETGIIENAVKINYFDPDFEDLIEALDKTKTYYVYCKSGGRSSEACDTMDDLGFYQTYNLIGGMLFWNGKIVP